MALKNVNERTPGRRKISVKNVKLSDQDVGFTFSGTYRGTVLGSPFQSVDKTTGELLTKQLKSVIMEDEAGNRLAYLADTGLTNALTEALVKEGQRIEIVKLEKQKLTKGRTMNQYDIFSLEA